MIRNLLTVLLIFLVSNLFATNIYVDQSAPAGGDGSSWATAFNTIQDAVDAASANDTILIAAGIYQPEAIIDISIPLQFRGGYPQGGGAQDITSHITQIQADFNPGAQIFIIFNVGIDADTFFQGLKFFNFQRAIYTDSSITVDQTQFIDAAVSDIRVNEDIISGTFTNCLFSGSAGPSIMLDSQTIDTVTVSNCVFENGTDRAISGDETIANFFISNCTVSNFNTDVGIIRLESPNAHVSNLDAQNNTLNSGSILNYGNEENGTLFLSNSNFSNNTGEGSINLAVNDGSVIIDNTDFNNNTIDGGFPYAMINAVRSNVTARNCRILNNSVTGSQARITGVRAFGIEIAAVFENCEWRNNIANGAIENLFRLSGEVALTIDNCILDNNGMQSDLFIERNATITNNIFKNYAITDPIFELASEPTANVVFSNNRFSGNTAGTFEIRDFLNLTSENNTFLGDIKYGVDDIATSTFTNEYYRGNSDGEVFLDLRDTNASIENSIFISDLASGTHKLVDSGNNVSLFVINSTFSATNFNNTHVTVDFDDDLPSRIRNSIIWSGNDLTQSGLAGTTSNLVIRHSLIKGENPTGTGNLNGNQAANTPVFVDPSEFDFRMLDCSPTVNAGLNSYSNESTDLLGGTRIFETTIDMGAYELQISANASCTSPIRPLCTILTLPGDGDVNVPVDTNLSWNPDPDATGYLLRVGTAPGVFDILDEVLVGSVTTYNLPSNLPDSANIFVRIIPFNSFGNALTCQTESFATETVPGSCTSIVMPTNGSVDVSIATNLSWSPVADATGYRLELGTSVGNFDLMTIALGNITTYDLPINLPESSEIFVRITPFNGFGNAIGCATESFTTETVNTSSAYITTWKTDNPGTLGPNQITIPIFTTATYNYDVDWGDGSVSTGETGFATHIYATPGIYTVSITGLFPRIYFNNSDAIREKLLSIEQWGDSSWTSMERAFEGCINMVGNFTDTPDLSNVTSMRQMFMDCSSYNSDMNNWDVSNVTSMFQTFRNATVFNGDISNWNTSSVESIALMFWSAQAFNQDISFKPGGGFPSGDAWNTSNVTNMSNVFNGASNFNAPIGNWNTGDVMEMNGAFNGASSFNQDIGDWNVINVTEMNQMFVNASVFNKDIGDWLVGSVETFQGMFAGALAFNQDISSWDISAANDLSQMFANAVSFNQDISGWNVTNVTNIRRMFASATSFDQNLGSWNVENVTNAMDMFLDVTLSTANYDALLIGWNAQDLQPNVIFHGGDSQYCDGAAARANMIDGMGDNWTISDDGLAGPTIDDLANQNHVNSYTLPVIIGTQLTGNEAYYTETNGGGTMYLAGATINFADFPSYPITLYIYDGSGSCSSEESFELILTTSSVSLPFITTWQTDNLGPSNDTTIIIPTNPSLTYNYNVDWGDGMTSTGETGNVTHTYTSPGVYTVSISGLFPSIYFNDTGDKEKLLTIEQWGDNPWTDMSAAFWGCSNLIGNFSDSPDLSNVVSLASMFNECHSYNSDMDNWDVSTIMFMDNMFLSATAFNGNIENWDTSNVISMHRMFASTSVFNRDIGNWNTSSVEDISQMFFGAVAFNQNINLKLGMGIPSGDAWNTSNVTDMEGLFWNAAAFNEPIGDWNTENVEDMSSMFFGASSFNQNIENWNVTSVRFMNKMFAFASNFDRDIGGWIVDDVEVFSEMFSGASNFNQDISSWNIDNATDLNQMFANAFNFNQDISGWNTSGVTNFGAMFSNAGSFDQNLGAWNVEDVTNAGGMFNNVTLSTINYDALLIGWNAQNLQPNVIFTAGNSQYCNGEVARMNMTDVLGDNWTIIDGGLAGPTVNDLTDQNHVDSYTLPTIIGTQLTGSEAYYTEMNGGGTMYLAGTTINFADFPSYPVTLYIYDGSGSCFSEASFELILTSSVPVVPACTILNDPIDGAIDVVTDTDITWDAVTDATHYEITIVSTSGTNNITAFDNGANTTYNPPLDFLNDDVVTVTITPYNNTTPAMSCSSEFFMIVSSVPVVPDCTNLMFPLNSSTNVPISTDLSWTAVANVDGYLLTIGTTSGSTDILNALDVGNVTTYNLPADLPENTEIFVTIVPYNVVGNATGCSEESFTTETIATVPNCTSLIAPSDGSNEVSITTNLSWNSISNATGYLLTVSTISGGNDILDALDVGNVTTHDLVMNLPEASEIFVTIIPYNSDGNAIGCTEESFFTQIMASLPECTSLVQPIDGSTSVLVDTDLVWNAIPNADGYILIVGTMSGDTDIINSINVGNITTFDFSSDLPADTEIFVTIVPYNGLGNAIGCLEESFTTEVFLTEPNCSSLISPINGSIDVPVTTDLSWASVSGADGYLLSLGTISGGTDILNTFDVGNVTAYDLPTDLPENTEIFVTVIPYNGIGNAMGCTEESFTTESDTIVLDCTTLTMPLAGAVNVSVSTNFSWNPVANANGYMISIGTATVLLDGADVGNALTYDMPFDLPENTEIIVQISPYINPNDTIGCTSEWFTTGAALGELECTNLSVPLNNAVNVPVGINISWNSVAEAEGYNLTVATTSGGSDIINNFDVGNNTTFDLPIDLPENTEIFVTIIPYNGVGDSTGCIEESFTTEDNSVIPICTRLITPLDLAIDVSVTTDLTWVSEPNATGYRLSVGTTSGGVDILDDFDVGNTTTYDLPIDLPESAVIYVNIVPYNDNGEPTGCLEEFFTTGMIPLLPECVSLISPIDTSTDISVTTDLNWSSSAEATGYILSIGTFAGATDILDNEDVGNTTTYDIPFDLPENIEIFVSIIPYNEIGDALACNEESFTTEFIQVDNTKYGFSPDGNGINDYWEIDGIENYPDNEVIIYNRWGDIVFKVKGYDNNSKAFRGIANQKTKIGANKLPSGTYFFDIIIPGSHNLKKTRGFVVLKR